MRMAFCLLLLIVGWPALAQESATLTGAITDSASTPLPKVSVVLSSLDRVLQEETDADGNFRFASVPPGKYDLDLSAPGFVKQKFPVTLAGGDSRLHKILLPLRTVPDVNDCGPHPVIRYEPPQPQGRRVTGIVRTYSDEKPVAGAKLILLRVGEKRAIVTSLSDRAGKFDLKDLPAGRYTLQVSRRGYKQMELKEFLISRENGAFIAFPMLERKNIVACQ